jgi:hypothetical protein
VVQIHHHAPVPGVLQRDGPRDDRVRHQGVCVCVCKYEYHTVTSITYTLVTFSLHCSSPSVARN